MVRVKTEQTWLTDKGVDVEHWLMTLAQKEPRRSLSLIQNACTLAHLTEGELGIACLQQGLAMADVLIDLEIDSESIAAAIIYPTVHDTDLSLEDVEEQLGSVVAKLVRGMERMGVLSSSRTASGGSKSVHQLDNIRKMLLAMVDDVRVVLLKLTERLYVLRIAGSLPHDVQLKLAHEVMDIYAPLANRLGIGAMKWELEDLAFRYLEPEAYKEIAKGLNAKRLERDAYVENIVEDLTHAIKDANIQSASVYGRSKHIHSIYRKMHRKHVPLNQIYDATAIRVLVNTEAECYAVLSLVHHLWIPIPSEFDDYIAHPKANGYQSLHTAVVGPLDRVFEVQIRTKEMHALAEMGVAAHWKYKEGGSFKEAHERKIAWLREVLAWHRDMSKQHVETPLDEAMLEDRVYVLTPEGDIFDLPKGSTPLDFAYHLHTQLGHRCRGAKINGAMVPLTTALQTGDQVEILTAKQEKPSRDWMSPHLHYLKTSRAKAKVLHWFKMQDYEQHQAQGRALLEKELKSLNLKVDQLEKILPELHYKTEKDAFAALGRGDLKLSQVIHRLSTLHSTEPSPPVFIRHTHRIEPVGHDLQIEGVGDLLTSMARCCQPVPGDAVIGYITLGRGVSIHRKDCPNILHSTEKQRQRFLQVTWGAQTQEHYLVDISIKAFDRVDLLKDITTMLALEKVQVHAFQTEKVEKENLTWIKLRVDVDGLSGLRRLMSKLSQIPNILEVGRQV